MVDFNLVNVQAVSERAMDPEELESSVAGLVRNLAEKILQPFFSEGEVIDRRAGHRHCCEDQETGDDQQQAAHGNLELR
jgi:hypothetical protein